MTCAESKSTSSTRCCTSLELIPNEAGCAIAVNGVSAMLPVMSAASSLGPPFLNNFFIQPPAMTKGPKGLAVLALWSRSHRTYDSYT